MKKLFFVLTVIAFFNFCKAQNIGINATGALPDSAAILDISSTTSGVLIPRMTTTQRNAINSIPNGLQVFNTSTSTIDVYRNSSWQPLSYSNSSSNLVNVYSLADLPTPSGSAITLDATKMYVFSGIVNISPYYLNLNGAGLCGIDPAKDGIMSTVSGGILRSTAVSVYIRDLAILPASGSTKAYDFADATGTKFCNIFSGSSVVEIGIPSLGVGQVSGFKAITIEQSYWNCKDGIKVTGTVGKFCSFLNFITNISAGSGIEFLAGLTIDDIDLSNNYFVYTGQTGVKVNSGATIDRGRMTTNMFRGVGTVLTGFDSYTPAWEMRQNTNIPNSRAFSSIFMDNNATATSLPVVGTYYKIAGTTSANSQKRFSTSNNRITYTGLENITSKIFFTVGGKSPANNSDFTICIAKNGTPITTSTANMAPTQSAQSFQITFMTDVDISTNDYLEVFIKTNNSNTSTVTISDMQFRITD